MPRFEPTLRIATSSSGLTHGHGAFGMGILRVGSIPVCLKVPLFDFCTVVAVHFVLGRVWNGVDNRYRVQLTQRHYFTNLGFTSDLISVQAPHDQRQV